MLSFWDGCLMFCISWDLVDLEVGCLWDQCCPRACIKNQLCCFMLEYGQLVSGIWMCELENIIDNIKVCDSTPL